MSIPRKNWGYLIRDGRAPQLHPDKLLPRLAAMLVCARTVTIILNAEPNRGIDCSSASLDTNSVCLFEEGGGRPLL